MEHCRVVASERKTMDEFEKAGYGQESIGFGERCAVLVVDLQKGFTDASNPLGRSAHVQRAVDNTARLLEVARQHGVPVGSCRVAWKGRDDMSYWKISTLYDGSFYYGHPCTEFDPRISDPEYDFQFTKTAPSIFFRTPLVTWLTKLKNDGLGLVVQKLCRARQGGGQPLSWRILGRPIFHRSGWVGC